MARPITKKDLLNAAKEQYEKMLTLIDSLSEEEREKDFIFDVEKEKEAHWKRDKNIRDLLVHLYEWQQLLLNWIDSNIKGEVTAFLPELYNWKTYGEMNEKFWKNHQQTIYDDSRKKLDDSHREVIKRIEKFSNEELFEKGILGWTGGSTLGSYCVSVTSSHYVWAMKKIKKQIKALKEM